MATALFGPKDRPLLHLGLLVATILSTFVTFFFVFPTGSYYEDLWGSVTFSLSVVLILGSHEMGHYVMSRLHGVDTSLPYFIPLPMLGLGTLGAVIRLRSRIPTRDALVDIGAWGPLAGIVVAIPVLIVGFALSTVVDTPPFPPAQFPGETSLWALGHDLFLRLTSPGPTPATPERARMTIEFGDNLFMLGLQWVVKGPLPSGKTVQVHPMVIAGWFGTMVTMLNLVPMGQLDGGHLAYALFGEKARALGKGMALGMLALCVLFSASWLVWLVVTTKFVGFGHPEVLQPEVPLSARRKWICAACLVVFVACVLPVPLRQLTVP